MRRYALFGIFIILFNISCSSGDSSLKDGYYTAEMGEFNKYGWKDYVTIRISGGKIIHVEYNSFNTSGFIKSWDMDYMRNMNAKNGTYPNSFRRKYGGKLLEKQGTEEIDPISGATASYHTFLLLADEVLENARKGNTETKLVYLSGDTMGNYVPIQEDGN